MAAVCIIQHFKQWISAFNYTTRFKKYSQLSKWNDEALMTMYHHELKDNIKNKLMCDECVINSLNKFTKAAIEIDNKLYKRVMKWKYDEENHE